MPAPEKCTCDLGIWFGPSTYLLLEMASSRLYRFQADHRNMITNIAWECNKSVRQVLQSGDWTVFWCRLLSEWYS